jgi:hypothetical protein
MATDKTEPRTKLIIGLAVLSVATLLIVRALLQSYFIDVIEEEQHRKIAGQRATQLIELRAQQDELKRSLAERVLL